MKVFVTIARNEAIKAGNDRFGTVPIEVDLKKLSPSQREELTLCPFYGKTEAPFITENGFAMEDNDELFVMPDSIFALMPVLGPLPDQKKIGELLDLRSNMRKQMGKVVSKFDKTIAMHKGKVITAFLKGDPLPEEPLVHNDCSDHCYCVYLRRGRVRDEFDDLSSDDVPDFRASYIGDPTYCHSERTVSPYMKAYERFVVDTAGGLRESYEEFCVEIPYAIPRREPPVKRHIQKLKADAQSFTAKSRAEAEARLSEAVREKKESDAGISLWINTYGSDHLKRVHREGYPCHGAYIEERCRHELALPANYYIIVDPPASVKLGERVMPSKETLDLVDMLKAKGVAAKAIWVSGAAYRDVDGWRIPVNGEAIAIEGVLGRYNLFVGDKTGSLPAASKKDERRR